MNIKPFSENIVFFDTEFTDLNARTGELLSIGLIKYTGEELYLELEYTGIPHPWVVEKVLPYLTGTKISHTEAREKIKEFIGDSQPFLMAYVNQFDAIFWYDLFGTPNEHPAFWIPIDFASVLFGLGYSPDSMGKHEFFKSLGIDKEKYTEHNALTDARLLRDAYLKFYDTLKL